MSDDLRKQDVLEQLDALGIGFSDTKTYSSGAPSSFELRASETDDELEPYRDYSAVAPEWEVDWWKAAGCLLFVVVTLGFWGLVAWTVARILRG